MRDIACSATANRVVSFHSQVHVTADNITSVPVWDDFLVFAKNCPACEVLVLERFGLRPGSATLALSQMQAVLALLVCECKRLNYLVIEIPLVEDYNGSVNAGRFVADMNNELQCELAPAKWPYLWVDYRLDTNGMPLLRFTLSIHKQCATLNRKLKNNLRFKQPVQNTHFEENQCTTLVANGKKCANMQLSCRNNIKFTSCMFATDNVHSQLCKLLYQIIGAAWAPRVATLSLDIQNDTTLSFDESPRSEKKSGSVKVWWKDIVDVLDACTHCTIFALAGNVTATISAADVILEMREVLENKQPISRFYAIFIELRPDTDDLVAYHNTIVVPGWESVAKNTWEQTARDGVYWVQGATLCTGGNLLIWAYKARRQCKLRVDKRQALTVDMYKGLKKRMKKLSL